MKVFIDNNFFGEFYSIELVKQSLKSFEQSYDKVEYILGTEEARNYANEYIISEYPLWKQLNILRKGTQEEKELMSTFIEKVKAWSNREAPQLTIDADGKPKLANKLPQTLEELKAQKIFEFERIKDKAQLEPVKVRDLFFFGGRENAQKYKEAFDLAKMMGKTSGVFAHTEGFVEVDEDFAKEVIIAVGAASYSAWYKFRQLETIVNSAKTKRELDKIKWED